MMAVLVGFDFLVGCIDEYLRIYDFNLWFLVITLILDHKEWISKMHAQE